MDKVRALLSVTSLCMAVLCQAQEQPVLRIYNKVSPERGFAIVSEDGEGKPLLIGYSTDGCFDTGRVPDNVAWWLSQYPGTMADDGSQPPVNYRQPAAGTPVVRPLIETHWSQDDPYNAMCPTWFGTPTMVGCVPLAVAQIMRYHRWPTAGRDSVTYYCMELMRNITGNFSQSRYDYDDMPDELSERSTEEQRHQVASLLYDCGVALKAEFWTTVTNALTNNVDEALIRYFRYDDDIKVMLRNNDEALWEQTIRHELDEGRPVYFSGKGPAGGHAFVCDGYDDKGMFHFNFGWGGKYDGYYSLGHIGDGQFDYSGQQQIFYNIKPNHEVVEVAPVSARRLSGSQGMAYDISGRRNGGLSGKKGIFIIDGRKVLR